MSRFQHDRAHYRVRYPMEVRPLFYHKGDAAKYRVVDLSERGIRYLPGGLTPDIGAEVAGTIFLRTGEEVEVSGVVVRIQQGEVAVHLTGKQIPYKIVFQEQKYLLQHYPLSLISG